MAEVAVHFSFATLPDDYLMQTIYVPDSVSMMKYNEKNLPAYWNVFPHPASTQAIGDMFVNQNDFCVLQIPSAVTRGDYNFLINPKHPEFRSVKIVETEKFPFDKRIFE